MYIIKSKKGVSLSLETIVVAIIILAVLAVVVIFFLKYGGTLFSSLGNRVDSASSVAKDVRFPQP